MTGRALAGAMQGRRAGFASRIAAAAIDITVVLAAYFMLLVGIGAVRFIVSDEKFEIPDPPSWLNGTAVILLIVLALAVAWSGSGRTIGDSAVGLRVVTDNGDDLTFLRAVGRAIVLVIIPVLSMLWILVSRKNAGIHDLVCHTTVIYDWRPRRERVRTTPGLAPAPSLPESRQNSKISP